MGYDLKKDQNCIPLGILPSLSVCGKGRVFKSDCGGEYQCMRRCILLSRANKKFRLTVNFIETSSSCIFIVKSICSLSFIQKQFLEN